MNERGAIMLIAVFFAIFGVAILYYMIGIGQAVLFRERMQDAADATALSAAIANARGMNFIVLINLVMAALLAILVTIKLVEGIAILGIFIAGAMAWGTFGATLVAIPPLRAIQQSMNSSYETMKPPVFTALQALHTTAGAVKWQTPKAADAFASADVSEHWGPSITWGVAFSSREFGDGLPVEDDTFQSLCGRAGEYPIMLASAAIGCPAISPIFDELEGAMKTITSDLSAWFCGDGSGRAPTYDKTENEGYPKLSGDKQCIDGGNDTQAAHAADTTNPVCEEQRQMKLDAQPDATTGSCQAGHDCSLTGPYNTQVVAAREQCDPTQSPAPVAYSYQVRTGRVCYLWSKGQWLRQKPEYDSYLLRSSSSPPCGPAEVHPAISIGYNKIVRQSQDIEEVLPVCSNEEVPPAPRFPEENTLSPPVEFTQVTQIIGCTKSVTKQVDFNLDGNGNADKPVGGADNDDKSPKRVESGVKLGDEDFHVRSFIAGKFPGEMADRIVSLPLRSEDHPSNPLSALELLGNCSVAQAEYFYEGNEGREDWMWHMKWRARLIRFRLPGKNQLREWKMFVEPLLPGAFDKLAEMESLIVH
jgi:hypothetical protein